VVAQHGTDACHVVGSDKWKFDCCFGEGLKHLIVVGHDKRCARDKAQETSRLVQMAHEGQNLERKLVCGEAVALVCCLIKAFQKDLLHVAELVVRLTDHLFGQVFGLSNI
jgi:hypothetical protein